jgi:hypothetical protein
VSEIETAIRFAESIKHKDYRNLNLLLHDEGEFNIQDFELETTATNKNGFIEWIKTKLLKEDIYTVEYDQCLHCKIGNQVVLFNKGNFPRKCKDDSERSRTGLMLDIKEDKIIETRFCFVFLRHDNRYIFECRGEKIKEFQNSGFSLDEAIKMALKIDDSTLF